MFHSIAIIVFTTVIFFSIDKLYPYTLLEKKPRTYRKKARKAFLAIIKQRHPGGKKLRRGIKLQLQYLRRNLGHIKQLLTYWPDGRNKVSFVSLAFILLLGK